MVDAADGPKVYLLSMTPDPLGSIAAVCKMYKGEVVRSLSDVTDAERIEYFDVVKRTKLKASFEFVKFHFMIEGVTRSFTDQMVSQRTAQVSLQENVATRLHYSTDFRALLSHVGKRLCTQDKSEWREVFTRIIEAIGDTGGTTEQRANGSDRVYFAGLLAELLDHEMERALIEPLFSPDAEEDKRLRQETLRAAETLADGGEVGCMPMVVANLLAMYEQSHDETERLQAALAKEKAESYRLREHGLTLIRERDQVRRERDGLAGEWLKVFDERNKYLVTRKERFGDGHAES